MFTIRQLPQLLGATVDMSLYDVGLGDALSSEDEAGVSRAPGCEEAAALHPTEEPLGLRDAKRQRGEARPPCELPEGGQRGSLGGGKMVANVAPSATTHIPLPYLCPSPGMPGSQPILLDDY